MEETSSAAGDQRAGDGKAAVHRVPTARIVAVEHPGIVKNFDNGFKSLGGEASLKHVLEHRVGNSKLANKQNEKPEPVAGVSLRPNDPLAKRIPSTGIDTRNVLIKVSLPRRTGRKRKRGSDEPFVEPHEQEKPNASTTAAELLQRLRDNEGRYTVEAVGMLHETHRFRTLPDFQIRNGDVPLMRHLRNHAMVPDYGRLKDFRVDLSPNPVTHTAIPGPPTFTSIDMPHKFEYRQPETLVYVQNEAGQVITQNLAQATKRFTAAVEPDVDEVPMRCPREIPPVTDTKGNDVPKAIALLKKLLDERPIVTKRVALNNLPAISETTFKEAIQYVGYSFTAGPFRDTLIKYGVDPRRDPEYRFYQTVMFQVDKQAFKTGRNTLKSLKNKSEADHSSLWARPLRHTKDDPTTHIFDGKNITANGKTWQLCDITDPIVAKVYSTDNIRSVCDPHQFGWFHNGTAAKGRAIMRDKMKYLFAGNTPPEEAYVCILDKIPEIITKANASEAVLPAKLYGLHAQQLSAEVRNISRSYGGELDDGGSNQHSLGRERSGTIDVEDEMEEAVPQGQGDFELEAASDEDAEHEVLDEHAGRSDGPAPIEQ